MSRCGACGQHARQPFRQAENTVVDPLMIGMGNGVVSLVRVVGVDLPGFLDVPTVDMLRPGRILYATGDEVSVLLRHGVFELV